MDKTIVGTDMGGVASPEKIFFNGDHVPMDHVGVDFFLAAIAACASKRIYNLLPQIKTLTVTVKALGEEDEEDKTLHGLIVEVEYTSHVDLNPEIVEEALWKCPVIRFLRDKIAEAKIISQGKTS